MKDVSPVEPEKPTTPENKPSTDKTDTTNKTETTTKKYPVKTGDTPKFTAYIAMLQQPLLASFSLEEKELNTH